MKADYKVVLDSCVLANFSVCDLLLRLAERPRLFLPRWSAEILRETNRTHLEKLGWPKSLANSFQQQVVLAFPEATVCGHEKIIDQCQNQAKDRHVLACAIYSQTELIVTFNQKDFSESALSPWNIRAEHPQDYLFCLYTLEPKTVLSKMQKLAESRNLGLEDYLIKLGRFLPAFSSQVLDEIR